MFLKVPVFETPKRFSVLCNLVVLIAVKPQRYHKKYMNVSHSNGSSTMKSKFQINKLVIPPAPFIGKSDSSNGFSSR